MAELQPRRISRFYYILQCNEQYSPFQAEAFSSLHWKGLVLPERSRTHTTSQVLRAEVENGISLTALMKHRPDPRFFCGLLSHLIALQAEIRRTHLMVHNLCLDPDSILFPHPKSEEEWKNLQPESAILFYLPIWKETQEDWESPPEDPDALHAYTGAESSRLGLLEVLWSCFHVQERSEAIQKEGLEAASHSLQALSSWALGLLNEQDPDASQPSMRVGSPSLLSQGICGWEAGSERYTSDPTDSGAGSILHGSTSFNENRILEKTRGSASEVCAEIREGSQSPSSILPPELQELVQQRMEKRRDEGVHSVSEQLHYAPQAQRRQLQFLTFCVWGAQILFLISTVLLRKRLVVFQSRGWTFFFLSFVLLCLILDLCLIRCQGLRRRSIQGETPADLPSWRTKKSEEGDLNGNAKQVQVSTGQLGPMELGGASVSGHNPPRRRNGGTSPGTHKLRIQNPAYITKALPGDRTELRTDRTYLIYPEFTIGTNPMNCDLLLEEAYRPTPIACIRKEGETYTIQKLDDLCIRINGKPLESKKPESLPEQATLTFGQKTYYFQSRSRSESQMLKSENRSLLNLFQKKPKRQAFHSVLTHEAGSYFGGWHDGIGSD